MPPVSATSANSSKPATGVNALLNLISSDQNQPEGISAQFKALLTQLGQNGAPTNAAQQQITDLLTKQQNGTAAANTTDLAQLQIKIKAILNTDGSTTDGTDPSAALISQIASLMQKFPALQELFTGTINTQQLQAISNDLAQGGKNPDFSDLTLPNDLKSQLQDLAKDPKASAAFQDAATQIAANPDLAKEVSAAAQNFAALINQNSNANANSANNVNTGLVQAAVGVLNASGAQPSNNSNVAEKVSGGEIVSGKARPQGLLKSSSQVLADQTSSETNNTEPTAGESDADASSNSFQSATQTPTSQQNGASATVTAETPLQNFLALSTAAAAPQSLTPEQTNSFLQSSSAAQPIAGVSEAYVAQQASNTAAAMNPSMQLAIQLQRNAQTNNNNFVMQLHPEEMGHIQVSLRFDGNKVQAKITAEKDETLQSLKQDSASLTKALNSAGLQTDSGSLEFSLGGSSQQFANQSQKNNNGDNQFGTLLASNTTDETSSASQGSSQWLTLGTGRVDVKL